MRKFGFKIFSTGIKTTPDLIKECAQFASLKDDMFIELMVVPTSSETDLKKIKEQLSKLEVRIHAPHNVMGFDAGNKELEEHNQKFLLYRKKQLTFFHLKQLLFTQAVAGEKNMLKKLFGNLNFLMILASLLKICLYLHRTMKHYMEICPVK